MTKPDRTVSPLSRKADMDLKAVRKRYGITGRLFRQSSYRNARMKVLLANARDYRRSGKLWKALSTLRISPLDAFASTGTPIGGDWKPFRVDRGMTGSMRGEISGGKLSAILTTNMLDSSSVLYLQNAAGETMRALLPSPSTATEMLRWSLESWRTSAGYVEDYYADYDKDRDTHTSYAINSFGRSAPWAETLVHPDIIDMIDASCQKAEADRPTIQLKGGLVQKGVALATMVKVNDEERLFVPTGFFHALTSTVRQFLPYIDEPRLIAA